MTTKIHRSLLFLLLRDILVGEVAPEKSLFSIYCCGLFQEQQGGKSVFQRVNLVQLRWKKQVEEQRSNVFEKQEMLQ